MIVIHWNLITGNPDTYHEISWSHIGDSIGDTVAGSNNEFYPIVVCSSL
jgi:hypothetical protein